VCFYRGSDDMPGCSRFFDVRLSRYFTASDEKERTTEARPAVDGDGAALKTPGRVALDEAFRKNADLRLGVAENLSQARTQKDKLDERVQEAFAKFNAAAPANGEPAALDSHVEPGVAPFETSARVMRERLDALGAAPPPGVGMVLRASNSLIEWDGGDAEPGHARTGSIKLGKLLDSLDARDVSSLRLATSSAVTACEAEHKAKVVVHEIDNASANGQDDHGDEVSSTRDGDGRASESDGEGGARKSMKVGEFVERSVAEQMGPATAPEERLKYGLIPNSADSNEVQAHLLDTFRLRPGPSDVTSYHDFSTLQIAFEDVWTTLLDGELEVLGRQLYREYVGLLDFLGYDPDTADRPISSLDDLTWLIGEIRALSGITQTSLPGGDAGGVGADNNVPKDAHTLGKDVGNWVDKNVPGGRPGLAVGTLGISELVLWLISESATFGRKEPLIWDDLVNDRTLPRGDRIEASVEHSVVGAGDFELVLWTDISNRKEIAFQVWDQGSQKPRNEVRVANWVGETVNHSGTGKPTWYVDRKLIPFRLLDAKCVLEFASEETPGVALGRYLLGDLDKIVADRGRLVFYWKDR
jgi:hypothetical protein